MPGIVEVRGVSDMEVTEEMKERTLRNLEPDSKNEIEKRIFHYKSMQDLFLGIGVGSLSIGLLLSIFWIINGNLIGALSSVIMMVGGVISFVEAHLMIIAENQYLNIQMTKMTTKTVLMLGEKSVKKKTKKRR